MNILITGSSGFIGSNLVNYLLKSNDTIIGFDKKQTQVIPDNQNFMFIQDDINNICTYKNFSFDMVYHLAASADIQHSSQDTYIDFENNTKGTYHLLEYLRKNDIDKLVFTSSSSVYGEHSVDVKEDNIKIHPVSLYGVSKLCNEHYIQTYCKLYGIKGWIFRLSNICGKYISSHVVYDFYYKLLRNHHRLEILGNGQQRRSFLSVNDCIVGITMIPLIDKNKKTCVYNIGNVDSVNVFEIAEVVSNEMGLNPRFITTGRSGGWKGDLMCNLINTDKIQRLGWYPTKSSVDVIHDVICFLKNNDVGGKFC